MDGFPFFVFLSLREQTYVVRRSYFRYERSLERRSDVFVLLRILVTLADIRMSRLVFRSAEKARHLGWQSFLFMLQLGEQNQRATWTLFLKAFASHG